MVDEVIEGTVIMPIMVDELPDTPPNTLQEVLHSWINDQPHVFVAKMRLLRTQYHPNVTTDCWTLVGRRTA